MSHESRSTRTSRLIKANAETLYHAFLDPAAPIAWFPPGEMTGQIHAFDARVGAGYRMSLFYPPSKNHLLGKTSDKEDMVDVRFLELTLPHRILEAIRFVTDDPALLGEMTMTATFEENAEGTLVTLLFDNLPTGLRPDDNDLGARLSLEQLAHRYES